MITPGIHCPNCQHQLDTITVIVTFDEDQVADIVRRAVRKELAPIRRELGIIEHEEEQLVTTVEELRTDFDTYKGDVTAAFARLQASIDAGGGIPVDVQAAIDDLDVAIKGADADANAEDPAAPPADGNGTVTPAE